jgi:hypothetical protein
MPQTLRQDAVESMFIDSFDAFIPQFISTAILDAYFRGQSWDFENEPFMTYLAYYHRVSDWKRSILGSYRTDEYLQDTDEDTWKEWFGLFTTNQISNCIHLSKKGAESLSKGYLS